MSWADILFVQLLHNCILNYVNHRVFPAKTLLTIWSVQRELRHKEAEQIVSDVLDGLLKGIQTPERPRSPVDTYITEEELFQRKNPKVGLSSSLYDLSVIWWSMHKYTMHLRLSAGCLCFISLWFVYTWNRIFYLQFHGFNSTWFCP